MAKKKAVIWVKEISRSKRPAGTHERIVTDKRREDAIQRAEDEMRDEDFDRRHAEDWS